MFGIDISEHNGDIDLRGYVGKFVIIRVGWGNFTEDKKFKRNVAECKRLGIPFGVYHYSYAFNPDTAKKEAEAVLRAIEPYRTDIRVGVWFDMEDADHWKVNHGWKISRATIEPICYMFCKIIEDAGYYSGIYCSQSWLQYLGESNNRFDKWVASWGTNDGTLQNNTKEYGTLHQYTSRPLDRDIMYADISRYDMTAKETELKAPSESDRYYISTSKGGLNRAIVINKVTGSVLPNCVGYAYGRFMEMAKIESCKLSTADAERWYGHISDGYERGTEPKVGAIICFRKGSASNAKDGHGHVAVVEKVNADGSVLCSMSNYGGKRWELKTYSKPYNTSTGLIFQGYIYNPYLEEKGYNGVQMKSIDELAQEVLNGVWGNGWNRENALKQAGYDYDAVQKRVNEIMHERKIEAVAREVIAGKYGNGWTRKRKLKKAGYDYNEVQKKVNELM